MSSDPIIVHVPADQIGKSVWNLDHGLPPDVPQWWKCRVCGERGLMTHYPRADEMKCPAWDGERLHWLQEGGDGPFPVTVTAEWTVYVIFNKPWVARRQFPVSDVHHADECADAITNENGTDYRFCHPAAEPGKWHWHIGEADNA